MPPVCLLCSLLLLLTTARGVPQKHHPPKPPFRRPKPKPPPPPSNFNVTACKVEVITLCSNVPGAFQCQQHRTNCFGTSECLIAKNSKVGGPCASVVQAEVLDKASPLCARERHKFCWAKAGSQSCLDANVHNISNQCADRLQKDLDLKHWAEKRAAKSKNINLDKVVKEEKFIKKELAAVAQDELKMAKQLQDDERLERNDKNDVQKLTRSLATDEATISQLKAENLQLQKQNSDIMSQFKLLSGQLGTFISKEQNEMDATIQAQRALVGDDLPTPTPVVTPATPTPMATPATPTPLPDKADDPPVLPDKADSTQTVPTLDTVKKAPTTEPIQKDSTSMVEEQSAAAKPAMMSAAAAMKIGSKTLL